MGLLLKADLETSAGATEEAYARIDTYRVDKVSSRIGFAVTYWKNKKAAHKYNRVYLEDNLKNATGLFSNKIVLYRKDDLVGVEYDLPTFLRLDIAKKVEIEEPILERVTVQESVPYVSFNEEGEEPTKYRTVEKSTNKQVGTNKVEKFLIDNTILSNIPKHCYEFLINELKQLLPGVEIKEA